MKTAAKYVGGLIALYLVVYYGTNSGSLVNDFGSNSAGVIKALQGR